ncbi:hypothetical protein ENUP19_0255G0022 [Entamoeba nuttalli]|uniref:Uncharacterized protein n=1 Tax=Entamoeba nuttalli TaxID=412467 RepID=A0ABQ0DRR9_9EUKA
MSVRNTNNVRQSAHFTHSIDQNYKKINISFIQRINQIKVDIQKYELYQLNNKFVILRTNTINNELYIDVDVNPELIPYIPTLTKFLSYQKCNEHSVFQLPSIITHLSYFRIPLPDILHWINIDISSQSGKTKFTQILLNSEPKEFEIILRGKLISKQFPQIKVDDFLREIQQQIKMNENLNMILNEHLNTSHESIIDNFINNTRINLDELIENTEFSEKRDEIIFAMIENVVNKNGKISPEQYEVIKFTSLREYSFDEEFIIDIICAIERDVNGQFITIDRKKKAFNIIDTNNEIIIQKSINDGILDHRVFDYNNFNEFVLNELVKNLIEKNIDDFEFIFRNIGENSLLTTKECGMACFRINGEEYVIVKNIDYIILFDEQGNRNDIEGEFSLFGGENDALFIEQRNLILCDEIANAINKKQEINGKVSVFYGEEF